MNIVQEEERSVVYGEKGEVLAECHFLKEGNVLTIDHTFVSEVLRGQKMAAKLVDAVMDYAKKNGYSLQATCSYAIRHLEKNPM